MDAAETAAASSVGAGLLGEIEETSLDEILVSLRTALSTNSVEADSEGNTSNPTITNTTTTSTTTRFPQPEPFPLSPLNALVNRHFRATHSARLTVSGRALPLVYALVAALVAAPHGKAVLVVDPGARFDASRLPGTPPFPAPGDVAHALVVRPARGGDLAAAVTRARDWLLYAPHGSRGREWWGTVVVLGPGDGGGGAVEGADVVAGWRGWLNVEREEEAGDGGRFAGMSAEEAMRVRDDAGADSGSREKWVARSVWGGFVFETGDRS